MIEAVQFKKMDSRGDPIFCAEPPPWLAAAIENATIWAGLSSLKITTAAETIEVRPGDWIIQGVSGHLYGCTPQVFAATYEYVA